MSWKNNKALAGILVVVAVAVVGYVGYSYLNPVPVSANVKCEKCEKGLEMKVSPKAIYPIECGTCKTKTVFPAIKLQCVKCQVKDLYVIQKDVNKAVEEKCKKCGEMLMP